MTILFISGLGGDKNQMQTLADALPEYSHMFRTHEDDRPVLEPCDIVGYSLGGGCALEVAARSPGLVRKVAVLDGAYSDSRRYRGTKLYIPEGIEAVHCWYRTHAPFPFPWGIPYSTRFADETLNTLVTIPHDKFPSHFMTVQSVAQFIRRPI